jgi:hypothetical protein
MSVPFSPIGRSIIAPYTDDSTDTSITITPGSAGLPNVLYCVNVDTANVVVVNTSFDALDTNATIPTSGANGLGVVIGPSSTAMIRLPQVPYVQGNLYVSVAGDSATGNVFITPGVL